MGTPEFAVPSLKKIYESHHEICAVVTKPDSLKGRGLKKTASPVKIFSQDNNLRLIQPKSIRDKDFEDKLKKLQPDLIVVVAFSILPENIINIPNKGSINLHASLLPKYRGAAPIQWAIAKGENETGVTIFFLNKNIDTGNIIEQKKVKIEDNETAKMLYDKLKLIGADTLLNSINKIESGNYQTYEQDHGKASKAPKLTKDHGKLSFNKTAEEIINQIRAFNPYPGSFVFFNGKKIEILEAEKLSGTSEKNPGTILSYDKNGIRTATKDNIVLLKKVKPQNKKIMDAFSFLNGINKNEIKFFDS